MQPDITPIDIALTDIPDFDAEGVDDFGSAGEFTGTLPGEQPPSNGAPTSNLDALLDGVDLSNPLDAFKVGVKVKWTGNILSAREWNGDGGRTSIVVDFIPTAPPAMAALGKQGIFCDIKGDKAAEGKATLRAIAKAAGVPADKPSMLAGRPIAGSASKGKKGDKMFFNF